MQLEHIYLSTRLTFGACSLALIAVILWMCRKNVIKEKYALLWLPLGLGFFVAGVFPELLLWLSASLHLHYMTVVVLGIILLFTNILLYFTMRMSQLREDVKKLSQELALSQAREPRPAASVEKASEGWVPIQKSKSAAGA